MLGNRKLEKFRHLLVIMTAISLSNAHLALMQGVTWIEMAVDAAPNASAFLPALVESVKPETKCERCCEIEKSQQEKHKRAVQWESKLIGTLVASEKFVIPQLQAIQSQILLFQSIPSVSKSPETPPPDLCS